MMLTLATMIWQGFAVLVALYAFKQARLFFRHRRLASESGCKPPTACPQKIPILGLDFLVETISGFKNNRYLQVLIKRHDAHGRTFSFQQLGVTNYSTCDPEVMRSILNTKFRDFSLGDLRRDSMSPILGKGILVVDDQEWQHQRAMIRPSFSRAQVTNVDIFERHATRLIEAIGREGHAVDMHDLGQRMVLDANTEYLFGDSIGCLDETASDVAELLNSSLDYAFEGVLYRLRLGKLSWLHRDPKFWASCKTVHDFAARYVDKALELGLKEKEALRGTTSPNPAKPSRYVLLNEMAKDSDNPLMLRDEIITILVAARDTTSASISFALYLLSRHPDVWDKLRVDALDHFSTPLTYDAIENMTYLKSVVKEMLRLFPPIANNGRMAVRDTVLPTGGGPDGQSPMLVAKGSAVFFSPYVMHRREDLWGPDAQQFKPERWGEAGMARHGWEYLPFLGGPRLCPGQAFAMLQISHTLARLAQAFEKVENLDAGEWREQWTLSVAPKDGVKVRFVPAV